MTTQSDTPLYREIDRLREEAAQLRADRDAAHSALAGLADCINAAHRNTNMRDPLFTDYTGGDMRPLIWELSYKANMNRADKDALIKALEKSAQRIDQLCSTVNILSNHLGLGNKVRADDFNDVAREALKQHGCT